MGCGEREAAPGTISRNYGGKVPGGEVLPNPMRGRNVRRIRSKGANDRAVPTTAASLEVLSIVPT